jgi:hypothetical protein
MLNARYINPFGAHKSWLTGGFIMPLTLVSTMSWMPLVVGFNACNVYDVLATDS